MDFKVTFILPNKEKVEFLVSTNRIFSITQQSDLFHNIVALHQYQVKSNIDIQILRDFLYHWNNNTQPQVDSNNILQYFQLFNEFGYLENYEELNIDHVRQCYIEVLQKKNNSSNDVSIIETKISQNLDIYLTEKYSEDFSHIPANSLYNIFYNNERKLEDHDKAYQFIIDAASNINENIFALLGSLDANKFQLLENKIDAFRNREKYYGFAPQNLGTADPENEARLKKLEQENEELKQKLREAEQKNEENIQHFKKKQEI
ncbi:hypothetical protein M9Y10_035816 [Tritrichomonas musculus]|uniref:BTB domain-containing protein n=1 Tax=Tritrichomonas musculus TaxID=1915356 RepID=A0ABR2GW38_9EUKA